VTQRSYFSNRYNVLYFGDEIDFRIIPKNCSSTLKVIWSDLNGLPYKQTPPDNPHGYFPNGKSELHGRRELVERNGGLWRDNALRFVIKRDPVERWLSGVNFAIQQYDAGIYEEFTELKWTFKDINDIVKEDVIWGIPLTEFYSQYYCGGNINYYDHVFDIRDFDKCKSLMEDILEIDLPSIYATVSKNNAKWQLSDLTSKSISDIKVLYQDDYTNGWC